MDAQSTITATDDLLSVFKPGDCVEIFGRSWRITAIQPTFCTIRSRRWYDFFIYLFHRIKRAFR